MDFGVYNKHSQPRGDHGTLIGNWVEERALKEHTGISRKPELHESRCFFDNSDLRMVWHSNNRDHEYKESIASSSFLSPQRGAYKPKVFHRTSYKWGEDGSKAARSKGLTQITIGKDELSYATSYRDAHLPSAGSRKLERPHTASLHRIPRTTPARLRHQKPKLHDMFGDPIGRPSGRLEMQPRNFYARGVALLPPGSRPYSRGSGDRRPPTAHSRLGGDRPPTAPHW